MSHERASFYFFLSFFNLQKLFRLLSFPLPPPPPPGGRPPQAGARADAVLARGGLPRPPARRSRATPAQAAAASQPRAAWPRGQRSRRARAPRRSPPPARGGGLRLAAPRGEGDPRPSPALAEERGTAVPANGRGRRRRRTARPAGQRAPRPPPRVQPDLSAQPVLRARRGGGAKGGRIRGGRDTLRGGAAAAGLLSVRRQLRS